MPAHIHTNREKGQTLIAVIVLLIIALSIGITVAEGFYKRMRTFSNTDSLSRANAVAEASVERILLVPIETLYGYILNNNCGAACHYEITGADGILSISDLTLSLLGNTSDPYKIPLTGNQTNELKLTGYGSNQDLSVCWNYTGPNPQAPAVFAILISGLTGSQVADSYAYNSSGSSNLDNGFSLAAAGNGYNDCFTVTGKPSPLALRLRSFYSDVDVYVIAANGQVIPIQGIKIVADGKTAESTKRITVTKREIVLPTQFDYVLLQKSATDPLSN